VSMNPAYRPGWTGSPTSSNNKDRVRIGTAPPSADDISAAVPRARLEILRATDHLMAHRGCADGERDRRRGSVTLPPGVAQRRTLRCPKPEDGIIMLDEQKQRSSLDLPRRLFPSRPQML
jgi:hypothetical protein